MAKLLTMTIINKLNYESFSVWSIRFSVKQIVFTLIGRYSLSGLFYF